MSNGLTDYQATYRRQEMALPVLLGVVAVLAAGVYAGIRTGDGDRAITIILGTVGFCLLAMIALLLSVFRAHRWTLRPDGIEIHERPKVPLMGIPHRVILPFADIIAFRRVESGFVLLLEIMTRRGRLYRMPQAVLANATGFAQPNPEANLDDFAAAIRQAAERSGQSLPELSEGLSFWNRPLGLICIAIMFILSPPIAAATGFALFEGGIRPGQPRGGQAIAIFLLLPVGAAYMFIKALRRRNAVLATPRAPASHG